jgi:hypothetical protein
MAVSMAPGYALRASVVTVAWCGFDVGRWLGGKLTTIWGGQITGTGDVNNGARWHRKEFGRQPSL